MRAAVYIRESSRDQGDGWSPDRQDREARQYITTQGWSLREDHVYLDLKSGRTAQRPAFQEMMEAAGHKDFDALIVAHTSRFMRSVEFSRQAKRRLRQDLGIRVVFLNLSGIDPNNPMGKMIEGFAEMTDEHLSDTISYWVTGGYREKFEQGGLLGWLPPGYRYGAGGPSAPAELDPVYGPAVREVFELCATGRYSAHDLAAHLNAQGLRTRFGRPFSRDSVHSILRNHTYLGVTRYHHRKGGDEERPGKHPPLITQELFDTVQEVRRQHRRNSNGRAAARTFPLTGIAYCAGCGERLHGETRHGRQVLIDYQESGVEPGKRCGVCVNAEAAEAKVTHFLTERFRITDEAIQVALAVVGAQEPEATEQRRRQLRAALDRLNKQHEWGHVGDAAYLAEYRQVSDQLAGLPLPGPTLRMAEAAALLRDIGALLRTGSPEHRREFFHEVLAQAWFRQSGERLARHDDLVAVRPQARYAPLFVSHAMAAGIAADDLTMWGTVGPAGSGPTDPDQGPVILGIRPLVERLNYTRTCEGQSTVLVVLPLGAS